MFGVEVWCPGSENVEDKNCRVPKALKEADGSVAMYLCRYVVCTWWPSRGDAV